MKAKPNTLSLLSAVRAIAGGQLTTATLIRSCLERIAERDDAVGAWAYLSANAALASAVQSPGGQLHGVPIGIKDLIDTVDMPTSYGSPIYDGYRPGWDATCVASIRNAGGIILGKTVTTEFAYFQPGKTANPHDVDRTPGGSSSGSAAAVADFQVPAAIGTQTAGSVIRPASYCGVVGYKPSYGLLPLAGVRPLAPSMDHIGIFARSVQDAGFLASILGRRPSLVVAEDDDGWTPRIGYCRTHEWDRAEPGTQALLDDAVKALGAAGATVIEVDLPASFGGLADAQALVMDYEVSFSGLFEVSKHREQVSAKFLERFDAGLAVTAQAYDAALEQVRVARAMFDGVMDTCDVLLCPSAPGEAPKGLGATGNPIFNRVWNFLGGPCVNVPGLVGAAGMPVGVQIVGRPGDDLRALKAAAWVHAQLN
jgi:Asp-tRNA(Asn)/Glu-tRNA(Gln) amidotransferase A subunit family amidase